MSKEQLKAFLEKVKGDTRLQERLKAAKSQDEVVSIAKEHGHEFETVHISQLSERDLEGVDGGGTPECHITMNADTWNIVGNQICGGDS